MSERARSAEQARRPARQRLFNTAGLGKSDLAAFDGDLGAQVQAQQVQVGHGLQRHRKRIEVIRNGLGHGEVVDVFGQVVPDVHTIGRPDDVGRANQGQQRWMGRCW